MPIPFALLALLGLGGGAAADQALNDGDIARSLGGWFAGAVGDVAGGATDFALEPIISLVMHDETIAEQISEAITSGEFNRAMDLFTDNFDQVNYQGFIGLIAGGYLANSMASSIGIDGARRLALVAPIAGLAATATSRLWTGIQEGNLDFATIFEDGNIWNAIMQGQEEGAQVALENRPEQPEVEQQRTVEPEPTG